LGKFDLIWIDLNSIYLFATLVSSQPAVVQSKQETELRAEVRGILEGVDARFKSLGND
jgi:hypothetical protein